MPGTWLALTAPVPRASTVTIDAPTPAASTGVKTPRYMPPMEVKMTPTRGRECRVDSTLSRADVRGPTGPSVGFMAVTMAIVATNRSDSRIPGRMPAMNSLPMLSSVRIAYSTKPVDGGMRMPSVPPAATDPVASPSPYPKRFICGSATLPIVTAVATDDPDTAAKVAHPTTVADARPPFSLPIQA